MTTQLKKACSIILLVLVCLLTGVNLAHFGSREQKKISTTVTSPVKKVTAAKISKTEFLRWQNDQNINEIELAARKALKWKIYGAVNCGVANGWGEDRSNISELQPVLNRAVEQYSKRRKFMYRIFIQNFTEGSSPSTETYIVDDRLIVGTTNGEIYEFWLDKTKLVDENGHAITTNDPTTFYSHRKWIKPTIKHKDNDILFFDASQKTTK